MHHKLAARKPQLWVGLRQVDVLAQPQAARGEEIAERLARDRPLEGLLPQREQRAL